MTPQEKDIVAYVRTHPGCDRRELSKALDTDVFRIQRLTRNLVASGVLTEARGRSPRGNPCWVFEVVA